MSGDPASAPSLDTKERMSLFESALNKDFEFVPSSYSPNESAFVSSPERSANPRKRSDSKRSPGYRPKAQHTPEHASALSSANFPSLSIDSPPRQPQKSVWEDSQKLKLTPVSQDFVPKGDAPEFIPDFMIPAQSLNVEADEFIPLPLIQMDSVPEPQPITQVPTAEPEAPIVLPEAPVLLPEAPVLPSEPVAEESSKPPPKPEPESEQPVVQKSSQVVEAAETGSSETEETKIELVPDPAPPRRIYTPDEIRHVAKDDRTRIISLSRVRELAERKIVGAAEMRRGYGKPRNEMQVQIARTAESVPNAGMSPIWRMERTREQKRLEEEAKAYRERITMPKDQEEVMKRTVKVTLNKLSPANFDKLKVQLLEQAKQSEAGLLLLSRAIFDKACFEVKFTELYANLCQYLSQEYADFQLAKEERKVDRSRFKDLFKKNVLYVCQEVFEEDPSEHVFTGMTEEEAAAKKALIKKRTLGNVRFIGELFKVAFVSARTVLNCVYDMTHPMMREEQDFRHMDLDEVNEDKLEGAATLLRTGGMKFEQAKLKEKTAYIMQFLEHVISSERLSSRVKFLLMNILDAHRSGWTQKTTY